MGLFRKRDRYGINDFGQVTGYSWTGNYDEEGNETYHAFLYSAKTCIKDLGTIGGSYSYAYSQGYSINDSGQIAGTSTNPGNLHLHAFLYGKGQMTDLNTFLAPSSVWDFLYVGTGINDLGQVMGSGIMKNGQPHAFVMTRVYLPSTVYFRGPALAGLIRLKRKRIFG